MSSSTSAKYLLWSLERKSALYVCFIQSVDREAGSFHPLKQMSQIRPMWQPQFCPKEKGPARGQIKLHLSSDILNILLEPSSDLLCKPLQLKLGALAKRHTVGVTTPAIHHFQYPGWISLHGSCSSRFNCCDLRIAPCLLSYFTSVRWETWDQIMKFWKRLSKSGIS